MMSATGLGEGTYELGGQKVTVTGLAARLVDGTLAGSVITMDQAIRNVVEWADVPVGSAMHMATGVPARLIGDATRGRLVEGARADLAIWSRDLRVVGTVVAGERVWTETPVS
jgi:N-acetylglucosamine-6-phosphate deacetylase